MTPEDFTERLAESLTAVGMASRNIHDCSRDSVPTCIHSALQHNPVFPHIPQDPNETFEAYTTSQYIHVQEQLAKVQEHLLCAQLTLLQLGAAYAEESYTKKQEMGEPARERVPQKVENPHPNPHHHSAPVSPDPEVGF